MHLALFLIFGALAVASAVNLVAQRHPINSALSLVVVMGSLAVLYLLLGAEFVAAIQVIVYAGAIMVLFIFVIMLLNAGEEERTRGSRVAMAVGIPGLIVLAGALMVSLSERNPAARDRVPVGAMFGPPVEVGRALFRQFLLPFEVTSILILIAIMGAVLLARYHAPHPPVARALDPDEAAELLEIAGTHGSATGARERARQEVRR
ncbi:MAG: NADH-quinone oxidoreductase subunit J [Acidobacteria bacterium]|nr:NADH-quinone oxidoreductase subunit J [Acidobacteriota bacterium]